MPEQLGKYTLEKRIGAGGMADVFLARGPQGVCVVKRPHPHLCGNPDFVRMFLDEAALVAQLNHPNIARVFDLGQVKGVYYLAMEYVPGFDLMMISLEHERQGEFMAPELAARVVADVASALHHAHQAVNARGQPMNIIHRDVTPHNVLLSTTGQVKLIDFGVAKAAYAMHRTQAGLVKGKYPYMAPEQITGQPIDRRVDIYAMGLVLYELLTNTRAIAGELEVEQIENARYGRIRPIEQVRPNVPEILRRILAGCIAQQPEARYPTGAALQTDLEMYLKTERHQVGREDLLRLFRVVAAEAMHTIPTLEPLPEVVPAGPTDATLAPGKMTELDFSTQVPAPQPSPQPPRSRADAAPAPRTEPHVPSNPGSPVPLQLTADRIIPDASNLAHVTVPSMAGPTLQTARPVQPVAAPEPEPPPPAGSSHRGVMALAIVALLVGIGVLGWKVFGDRLAQPGPTDVVDPVLVPPPAPVEPTVVAARPVEPTPIEPKPVEVKPVEVKPVEVKPVEAKPVEAKPVEPKHVEAKPVEPKPVERKPVAASGRVTFSSTPPTDVYINGKKKGVTPMALELAAGTYNVVMQNSAQGLKRTFPLKVTEGEPQPVAWVPKRGTLVIRAEPMAIIVLDGKALAATPISFKEVEVWEGAHHLDFELEGREKRGQDVTVVAGESKEASVNFFQ